MSVRKVSVGECWSCPEISWWALHTETSVSWRYLLNVVAVWTAAYQGVVRSPIFFYRYPGQKVPRALGLGIASTGSFTSDNWWYGHCTGKGRVSSSKGPVWGCSLFSFYTGWNWGPKRVDLSPVIMSMVRDLELTPGVHGSGFGEANHWRPFGSGMALAPNQYMSILGAPGGPWHPAPAWPSDNRPENRGHYKVGFIILNLQRAWSIHQAD